MEFFHLLKRGVDKRNFFLMKVDYYRFIHDLFEFNDENYVEDNLDTLILKSLDLIAPYNWLKNLELDTLKSLKNYLLE